MLALGLSLIGLLVSLVMIRAKKAAAAAKRATSKKEEKQAEQKQPKTEAARNPSPARDSYASTVLKHRTTTSTVSAEKQTSPVKKTATSPAAAKIHKVPLGEISNPRKSPLPRQ